MDLRTLNEMQSGQLESALLRCCGSRAWVKAMIASRPFADRAALFEAADRIWNQLAPTDWLEAFAAHPRIGEPVKAGWSAEEQAGARSASDATLRRLADANRAYEARFGHIFIVCATGRTADEMVQLLEARIGNDTDREWQVAAEEQRKITRLRLEKLLDHEAA